MWHRLLRPMPRVRVQATRRRKHKASRIHRRKGCLRPKITGRAGTLITPCNGQTTVEIGHGTTWRLMTVCT